MVDAGVAEGARCWQPRNPLPEKGCFFPPTLLTDVHPAATVVQEEIFGPVLVAMTFRTPAEAAELANNTVYGLAASIWSENINVALDLASQVKAGVVWVNCTNQFDAACGFGGYRESGLWPRRRTRGHARVPDAEVAAHAARPRRSAPSRSRGARRTGRRLRPLARRIDRTVKQYIGGKQARPDSGYSFPVYGQQGRAARRSAARQSQRHSQRGRSCAQCRRLGTGPRRTAARRSSTTSPKT